MQKTTDQAARGPATGQAGGADAAALAPLWLLTLLSAFGPFTMNVTLPAMPAMAADFAVSYGVIQLQLTMFLVAIAVAQLFVGPLSDRYGRRPLILFGVAIYILGALFCALAPNVGVLIFARCIQAAGGAAGIVLARAICHDIYGRERAASMIAYVTMAMVVAPMIAPAIGGFLAEHASWRYIFWLLLGGGGLLLLTVWQRLRETRWLGAAHGLPPVRLSDALTLMRLPLFWAFTGTLAFSSAMFFSFIGGAPYVVVELMGRPASEYGLYFVLTGAGYMTGNMLSGRYSVRFGSMRMISAGVLIALGAIGLFWIFRSVSLFSDTDPLQIFIPMMLVAIANGLVLPNATATTMSVYPSLAGSASGIAGALQMGLGAFMTAVVGWLLVDSVFPLIAAMTVCGILAVLCFSAARRIQGRSGRA